MESRVTERMADESIALNSAYVYPFTDNPKITDDILRVIINGWRKQVCGSRGCLVML